MKNARNIGKSFINNWVFNQRCLFMGILFAISINSNAQSSWESLEAIPKKWVKLEKDSIDDYIYNPNKDDALMLSIEDGYISIYWQNNAPEKWSMEKFTRLIDNKAFYIHARRDGQNIDITSEIIDGKRQMSLWTFGDLQWIMTPYENGKGFKQLNH